MGLLDQLRVTKSLYTLMEPADLWIKTLISDFSNKIYDNQLIMQPRAHNIDLSSSHVTSLVTFLKKNIIFYMVTNEELLCPDNILLDPNNYRASPIDTLYYGEVNSGL